MQISISQAELEIAVTGYLRSVGITGDIDEITFTQTRSPTQILTTIEMESIGGASNQTTKPSNVESIDKSKGESPAKREEPAPEPEAEEAPAAEATQEEVTDEAIPFDDPQPAKEDISSSIPAGKSLFG